VKITPAEAVVGILRFSGDCCESLRAIRKFTPRQPSIKELLAASAAGFCRVLTILRQTPYSQLVLLRSLAFNRLVT
jgi:hypothetical protein